MPQPDMPLDEITHAEILLDIREIRDSLRYVRTLLAEFEPLLAAVRGNGNGDAVRAAGVRRALRKARDG